MGCQFCRNHRRRHCVLGHTGGVHIDGDFFFLFTHDFDVAHRLDVAKTLREAVGEVAQLARRALVALDGEEQGRSVAEVVDDRCGQYALRQVGLLEQFQSLAHARPSHLGVFGVVDQRDEDEQHTVFGLRIGLGLVHVTEGEQVLLDGLGHPLFDFVGGGTGVDDGYHANADGHVGELVFLELGQGEETKHNNDGHEEEHEFVVPHRAFNDISFLSHSIRFF